MLRLLKGRAPHPHEPCSKAALCGGAGAAAATLQPCRDPPEERMETSRAGGPCRC